MRGGRIVGVLTGLADEDAIAKARRLFNERKQDIDGFELWDRARCVVRFPDDSQAKPLPGVHRDEGSPKASGRGRADPRPEHFHAATLKVVKPPCQSLTRGLWRQASLTTNLAAGGCFPTFGGGLVSQGQHRRYRREGLEVKQITRRS